MRNPTSTEIGVIMRESSSPMAPRESWKKRPAEINQLLKDKAVAKRQRKAAKLIATQPV